MNAAPVAKHVVAAVGMTVVVWSQTFVTVVVGTSVAVAIVMAVWVSISITIVAPTWTPVARVTVVVAVPPWIVVTPVTIVPTPSPRPTWTIIGVVRAAVDNINVCYVAVGISRRLAGINREVGVMESVQSS